MLEPLTGKPRKHNFVVYDLEWWPGTYELRMVGVYDAIRGYRYYTTIESFFESELTSRNRSRRFYAHFGGSSDVLFLLHHAINMRPDLSIDAIFAGSSAVVLRFRKGERAWTFVDSGYLIRRPLADIGDWIGLEKGDKNAIWSENFEELKEYNERDCRILYEAIAKLQTQVNNLGGELRSTLASTALDIFRRRFLKSSVATSKELNLQARTAYIASRVEVFNQTCPEGQYYDINSSFPASMCHAQPGDVKARLRRIPNNDDPYIADVTVTVPPSYLPPLPYRTNDGRLIFPTGTWRGVYDKADIELLLSTGGKIDTVHDVTTFNGFTDLRDYAQSLYEYKNVSKGYEREVWKLLLNALYGKFGERTEKRQIVIRPNDTRCQHSPQCPEDNPCISLITPNVYSVRTDKDIPHAHVPISVHITALSRSLLYSSLQRCSRLFYCDTDSVVCGRNDILPTSPAMGDLKHEYTVRDGRFLAPKLYTFCKDDGKRVVRAKGFSRLDYEGFCRLAEGKEHVITRMARIREGLNADGTFAPRDIRIPKRVHLTETKRRFLPSGDSEPWRVSELLAS